MTCHLLQDHKSGFSHSLAHKLRRRGIRNNDTSSHKRMKQQHKMPADESAKKWLTTAALVVFLARMHRSAQARLHQLLHGRLGTVRKSQSGRLKISRQIIIGKSPEGRLRNRKLYYRARLKLRANAPRALLSKVPRQCVRWHAHVCVRACMLTCTARRFGGIPNRRRNLRKTTNDTCGIRTHAGRPHRLSRPTP